MNTMKILHLSEGGLPDWRIEKSAQSAQKNEHEVVFGGRISSNYTGKTFSKIYEVNWTLPARLGLRNQWMKVKKQVKTILENIKPDMVHAHNVFSAKMISEFDYPFVYDDHEYWSMSAKLLSEMTNLKKTNKNKKSQVGLVVKNFPIKMKKVIVNRRAVSLWTKWEKELVSLVPTLTVSNKIAKEHRKKGNSKKIFVLPNFPMSKEFSDFTKPHFYPKISSVYAGSDGKNKVKYSSRNLDGLTDIFEKNQVGNFTIIGWKDKSSSKVIYKDFLPRNEMYHEMSNHSIGLLPWKNHWSHLFLSPNKPYEYAHAGLLVVCTSSLESVIENLEQHCVTFDDYDDLLSKLKFFNENPDELFKKRIDSFEFARKNLIWEKYEKNILNAYQLC